MSAHPELDAIQVLYRGDRENKHRATLFRMVDGKGCYESITREDMLILISTAAHALREMERAIMEDNLKKLK